MPHHIGYSELTKGLRKQRTPDMYGDVPDTPPNTTPREHVFRTTQTWHTGCIQWHTGHILNPTITNGKSNDRLMWRIRWRTVHVRSLM